MATQAQTSSAGTPRTAGKEQPLQSVFKALRAFPLFSNLNQDEISRVAALLTTKQLNPGDRLISLAGKGEIDLYIVHSGKALLRGADGKRVDDVKRTFRVGEFINDVAFTEGRDTSETVEAVTALKVWVLPHKPFKDIVEKDTDLQAKLVAPKGVTPFWARGHLQQGLRLEPGEVVHSRSTKHWWLLIEKVWWAVPIFIFLLFISFFPIAFLNPIRQSLFFIAGIVFLGLVVVGAVFFLYNDWHDDFYVVTNRRVIHREKVLFLSERQDEAPIERIQNVTVKRNLNLANALLGQDIGDIEVETSSLYHNVSFVGITNPEDVSKIIFRERANALIVSSASTNEMIRSALRVQMDIVGDKPENLAKPSKHKVIGYNAPIEAGKPPPPPLAVAYGRILFPPTRIEEGDTITYHHHPLRLLQTAGPAAGTLLLYIIVLVLLRVVLPSVFSVITAWPFSLVAALVAVALIGWVIWFYEDWRNDIFLLTSKKIVDVDRAPFGFGKTQQREASLDAVQNVTSKKNGFLETQLDMGSVVVKTGGAEGDLIFNQAADPRGIQRDIAYKMSLLNAGKRSKEVEDELSKMSKWLGIYDEMARLEYGRKKDLK